MARNVLFLVHGIGRHADTWSDEAIDALQEASQRYEFFQGKSVRDLIDFVPLRFDDIFDRILEHWQSMAEGLADVAPLLPDALDQFREALVEAGDDEDDLIRFGGDVVLYRGFKLFAQRVQIRVIAKVAAARRDRMDAGGVPVRFSALGHSMGTAVLHDALHHLGTESWLAGGYDFDADAESARAELEDYRKTNHALTAAASNPFSPERFRFDRIFMIANTSRLLHTTVPDPYQSIVRPNTEGHPGSYCKRYYDIAHKLDPVARLQKIENRYGKLIEDLAGVPRLSRFVAMYRDLLSVEEGLA
jgi:hypothetical protein